MRETLVRSHLRVQCGGDRGPRAARSAGPDTGSAPAPSSPGCRPTFECTVLRPPVDSGACQPPPRPRGALGSAARRFPWRRAGASCRRPGEPPDPRGAAQPSRPGDLIAAFRTARMAILARLAKMSSNWRGSRAIHGSTSRCRWSISNQVLQKQGAVSLPSSHAPRSVPVPADSKIWQVITASPSAR